MICDPVKSVIKVSEAYDPAAFQGKPGTRHIVTLGTYVKTSVEYCIGANGIGIGGSASAG